MEIILIAAMTPEHVIGHNNSIPWNIPGEQTFFKETTWGYPIIMGRKTHESIACALPGRRNIVISRNTDYTSSGCEICHSLQDALSLCANEKRVFIIGGEYIFQRSMAIADTLLLTIIDKSYDGDTWFPHFTDEEFELVHSKKVSASIPYTINTYKRRQQSA